MPNLLPTIDKRSQEQLIPELRRLIFRYCRREWSDMTELEADKKADALVRIFANMMGKMTERLNKAPEKNFISFLNMIGISPTPPRAAKAPLLFTPKADAERIGTIPAGTKVSAQPESGGEVIFETEKDLTVIRPRLVRAVSLDPGADSWSDQSFLFAGDAGGRMAELFRGEATVAHRLYLGHSRLLGFREAGNRLSIQFNKPGQAVFAEPEGEETGGLLDIDWYIYGEDGEAVKLVPDLAAEDHSGAAWKATYRFDNLPAAHGKALSGYEHAQTRREWNSKWIFAELKSPITAERAMPDIEEIRLELSIQSPAPLAPNAAISNGTALDTGKDYYPFGEKPKVNDTFYLACGEAFSKPSAEIAVAIDLSDPEISPLPDTPYVKLEWEYWNGTEWQPISGIRESAGAEALDSAADRRPGLLTASGTLSFTCPGIKPSVVNGEENYWIRVRITGGNYGEEAKYDYQDEAVKLGENDVQIAQLQFTPATYAPPSVRRIGISYAYMLGDHPELVLTENNFSFEDKTDECREPERYFKPFYPSTELEPTFYLGFDQDVGSLPVSLFFPLTGEQLGSRPIVAWEYWDGRRWMTLSVSDETRHFTRREILQFAVPEDIEARPLFGTEHYWIRARLDEGEFKIAPQLDAIYANAVWARNSNTVSGEIPGSSNGEENQSFRLSKTPVLPGQSIWVREASGQGEWVLWDEVDAFSVSDSSARHYMLDRSSGVLQFGDGKNGMIPPTGIENIKCDYKHGGGAAGNVAAGTIIKMWDSFNWLESVTNPVPADGGFDQEETDQAALRGPHTLKSWNRGVTAEDMEWLVREAMPQIAKVKCLGATDRDLNFVPGTATVIVVPEIDNPRPTPSQELLSEIETYLRERTSAVLDTELPGIAVTGPDYVRIGIEAKVAYSSIDQRKVTEGRIIDNLKRFFHPLHGGDGNAGWDLGKNLYVSEVYAVIKDTPGVDYVSDIAVKSSAQCWTLGVDPLESGPYKPLAAYPKFSAVRSDDNTIYYALAEAVPAGSGVKTLMVKGFKERDIIRLRYRGYAPVELLIESVDGEVLGCRTLDGEPLKRVYPEGSDVEFGAPGNMIIRSYILNELPAGAESFSLKIAVFEPGDIVYLSRNDEYVNMTPLKLHQVSSKNIFLEEGQLIFGGIHFINKPDEPAFPYLLDKLANQVHDLSGTVPECRLASIAKEERKYLPSPAAAPDADRCPYCFPAEE
ncbi:putative baseplate assembly protein [Paenibacillus macerans]|uniref:putative baseplate assembly protein n=1 Tax=Paenibacillus macerans TaxID=44252 RepID=UPI00203C2335|nr:putative baseplate assembly protein [Paenibacillus macerans]MCM3702371.1 putative baseplate assembly protein [Paenibacillus macerans]